LASLTARRLEHAEARFKLIAKESFMPLVSVIIPTYNRARFLGGAIRSVFAQSFKDVEVIVVDDCGSDDTEAVIKGLPKATIRYFRHGERRGGAAARNTGITESSGEFIAFLDDDDEWYPEKLARQMQIMLASPAEVGAVHTGYFIVDRGNGQIRGQMVPTERGDLYEKLLAGNCIGGTSSMLMRRSCFEKIGLFDERLPSFQDYDLWLRAARKYHFECIREPMLKYFVHADKIWTNSHALIQGLELMLEKYGHAPAFRRKCATYYLGLGVQYCDGSQCDAGRKALLRAARLNPLAVEPYIYLGLSMLGGENFRRARQAKARFMPGAQSEFRGGIAENA
jgi:glycosyltransferase involved in cell wall biosynthesis